jgi:hypothetical protein
VICFNTKEQNGYAILFFGIIAIKREKAKNLLMILCRGFTL